MQTSLAVFAIVDWVSVAAAVWLGYRCSRLPLAQAKQISVFIAQAGALVFLVLIPALYAAWTVIGGYPVGACPNCSPLTVFSIWTTIIFTVALVMAPILLVVYFLSLRKA
ncbi:hypothetical protein SFA35_25825 (plasmid) [Pseudomonas sp. HR96]|uniref:hypothetical protein n=1 Tax=Pseudomonas sp. HR96 TaxID=1027966 RepID=UPI002A7554E5|nr:hypothetical protein [Pseudomonas sp. HR96]WPP02414.1 hypothetical protein SFA35_25825 [Pseudomonas sp. HR96]